MVRNIRRVAVEEGPSTITQQLVPHGVPQPRTATLVRKLKEAALAGKIEAPAQQQRSLDQYINYVNLARRLGVADAAWSTSSQGADQLSPAGKQP